ncbi:MAG: hypothetical protein JXR76_12855 [Deltaproteobacteria bacterium]|nr:hypothetical protein [Deltaproteobacteria bacterium]
MRVFFLFFLTLLFIISVPKSSKAQAWLEDRDSSEGPGIKLSSSLVLHLGLGTEVGFDSNATYDNDAVRAARLRVTPYVDISTRSGERTEKIDGAVDSALPKALFRFGVAAFYDRYFASEKDRVEKFNSKTNPFGVDSHLNFTVYPERKVSLLGGVTYIKTLEPYESSSDAQNKHHIVPMLGFKIKPGGGTLTIEPKYRLDLLVFDDKRVGIDYNRFSHEASLLTNWKIFPKTALISNVIFRPTVYFGDHAQNVDSYPLRSWFGAQGLLLERFGFRALLGYGVGFYEQDSDFEGIIGDGAVMFYFSRGAKLTVGIKRDFMDSFYANYYVMTGGYANYQRIFAGRLLLSFDGSVYKRKYAYFDRTVQRENDTSVTPDQFERDDVWIAFKILSELRASDWLSFHMSLRFLKDVTDFSSTIKDTSRNPLPTEHEDASFSRVEIFLGARAHY